MLAAGVLLAPRGGRYSPGEAVLLLQLFPLRNLGRISIFLPNRASKLCCEQFGNSRRVSGSLATALYFAFWWLPGATKGIKTSSQNGTSESSGEHIISDESWNLTLK